MFCQHCGKEVPEGASFCANCGQAVNAQAAPAEVTAQPAPVVTAPAQPSAVQNLLSSFLGILKGVFSKDVVKTVGNQAKNTGNEWIIGIILSVLAFAFALPVNVFQFISMIVKEAAGAIGSNLMKALEFPFFSFFGASLLIGVLVLGALVAGLWLLTKLVAKKSVSWICVLNLVATAVLPLSICYIANMLLGLIWMPLAIIVSITALCMTMVLLYAGFQKLEKPTVSPFYPYALLTAVVVVVAVLFSALLYTGIIEDWVSTISSSAIGSIGGLLG